MSLEAATFEESWAGSRGVLAQNADVTPQRGEIDASRLKFSMRLIIQVVCAFLGGLAAMYTATSGMRSDLRDMHTLMTMQAEIDKTRQQLQDERAAAMKADVNAIKAHQELYGYDMQTLKTDVAIMKAQGAKK